MLISELDNSKNRKYSDNKIYRGIRHYDNMPLVSSDIHEYTDTVYMKTAYIMNNIVGYGILNTPGLYVDSREGVRLAEPAVVMINGDISLIQSDDSIPILSTSAAASAGYTSGTLCVVGWYQEITANSVLRNYGGVDNSEIVNDLLHEDLKLTTSTRCQFRWVPVLLSKENVSKDNLVFELADRDSSGSILDTKSTVVSISKKDSVFIADTPSSMRSYAKSELYIVPILEYQYSNNTINGANMVLPVTPKGSSGFLKSNTEPVGEYVEGTTWYNPITREFRTYVSGTGFVDSASSMGFLQYQSAYTVPANVSTPRDIVIPVNISEFREGDILQVVYEGLTLSTEGHYTVDYATHSIVLKNFTLQAGEVIVFTVTKIVEANDITSITATFTSHMSQSATNSIKSHVTLSDSTEDNSSNSEKGIAATPKAVYQSTLIKDTKNNINYKFGVEDGLLYLVEV